MTVAEVVKRVRDAGGSVTLNGDKVRCVVPPTVAGLSDELKRCREELLEMLREEERVVYWDVPCTCSEKPYPHFRHRDGSGPGSGHKLEPGNARQANATRRR